MSIVDRNGRPLTASAVAPVRSIGATISPYSAGMPRWTRSSEQLWEQGLAKLPLIFRCVQYTANAAGQSGVTLRVYDGSDGDKPQAIDDHPLRLLMKQPNPTMREGRFLSYITMVAAIAGFVVIEKVRSAAGRVVALEPLNTAWLKPILRSQALPDWEYRIPGIGQPFVLPSTDVLVFTYADRPNVRMDPTGMSPVEIAFREIGLLNTMTDFLKIFFDRGAMPVYGALVDSFPGSSPMTQAEKDTMTEAFVARHGGLDKAAIPILLEGIKDIKRLSFDFDELALTDVRDMADIAICQAFGIDPSTMGTRVGMEHSDARANATEANRKFYRDTMIPLWNRLDETLTLGLLSEFETLPTEHELAFDYSNVHALAPDRDARASWLGVAVQGGYLSQHRFLDEMELPIPDTPDFYLRGLAVQAIPADDPLGIAAQEAADAKAAEQAKVAADAAAKAAQAPDPNADATADPKKPAAKPSKLKGSGPELTLVGVPPSEQYAVRAKIGASNRAMVNRIGNVGEKLMKTYFRQMGERIVKAVEAPSGVATYAALVALGAPSSPVVMVNGRTLNGKEPLVIHQFGPRDALTVANINWDHEEKQLATAVNKIHSLSGETAAANVSTQTGVGISWDLANPHVRKVMDKLAGNVVGINQTSKDAIAELVTQAAEAGKSRSDLADDLRGLFSSWTASRASTVARTEAMTSYGLASAAGYRMSDVVDRIQCFDNENHTDDYGAEDGLSCAERDGLIDDLDSADLHIESEHPNGSLAIAPVLKGAT